MHKFIKLKKEKELAPTKYGVGNRKYLIFFLFKNFSSFPFL